MSPERVSVGGEGEVIPCRGTETAKAREPTVKSLVRGIWRLRYVLCAAS